MVKTTPYQPISIAFVQKDRYCSGNTPTKTAQIAFMSRAYPRLRRPPRCCGHLSDAPGPLRYGGRVLAGAPRRPRWTGGTGRPVGWPGSRGVAHATGVPKDQEERQAVRECDRREGAAESVWHRSLLRVFGGGVSSLTRDTRTPGHPGESAWTRRRRDEGPHEPDLCQPGSGAIWRRVRRGRPSPGQDTAQPRTTPRTTGRRAWLETQYSPHRTQNQSATEDGGMPVHR